jgi:hypothetical protein
VHDDQTQESSQSAAASAHKSFASRLRDKAGPVKKPPPASQLLQ